MPECSFMYYEVVVLNAVAFTYIYDITSVSRKKFPNNQEITECRFTLNAYVK